MLDSLLLEDSRYRAYFSRPLSTLMVYSSCLCNFSFPVSILFLSSLRALIWLEGILPSRRLSDSTTRLASFSLRGPGFLSWWRQFRSICCQWSSSRQRSLLKYPRCGLSICGFASSSYLPRLSDRWYFCGSFQFWSYISLLLPMLVLLSFLFLLEHLMSGLAVVNIIVEGDVLVLLVSDVVELFLEGWDESIALVRFRLFCRCMGPIHI